MLLLAGPTSALLQHLRDHMPQDGSGSAPGTPKSSAGGAAAISITVAAAAAAVAAAERPSRAGNSGSGGGELVLRGKGLTSIPAELWEVCYHLTCMPCMLVSYKKWQVSLHMVVQHWCDGKPLLSITCSTIVECLVLHASACRMPAPGACFRQKHMLAFPCYMPCILYTTDLLLLAMLFSPVLSA